MTRALRLVAVAVMAAAPITLLVPTGLGAPAQARVTLSDPATVPAGSAADRRALALLRRMGGAQSQVGYTGTQFVATWARSGTSSQLVELRHLPGVGTAVRVLGTSARPTGAAFMLAGSAASAELAALLDSYDPRVVAGGARVAGRDATVVEVRSRTGARRPAARFWIDDATGLMLRREVYDGRGRTWRASAFLDLTVGGGAPASAVPPEAPRPWPDLGAAGLAWWRSQGADCPRRLPAGMTLLSARRTRAGSDQAVHLHYSDGLSSLSVFVQRGRLDAGALRGSTHRRWAGHDVWVADGEPAQISWTAGGMTYTVVADAPGDTTRAVVAGLPHDRATDGARGGRMERGMSRVASWMNPFG